MPSATVAAPVIWSGTASGAEVKAAVCPGMSTARPLDPRNPRPGKTDIDAGAPPAGLTIVCGGPASRTAVCVVPPSPGYLAAVAMPSTSWSLDGS